MDRPTPFYYSETHRQCVAAVLQRIGDYYGARLVSVAIFGSYARGRPRMNSDLDLLIVLESNCWSRLSERTEEFVGNVEQPLDGKLQDLFEQGIAMDLSPIILSREEAKGFLPLYLDMASNCLILQDREGFFAGVLERVKRQMSRWRSERINVGGHWLWEIRPGLKWNEVLQYDK